MIIKQVKLVGFGKFKQKTLDFSDGLNLVIGPNETGKSTIQAAIYCAFFGKPKDYKFWGETGKSCRVEVIYEASKSRYKLVRDLAANKLFLADGGANEFAGKTKITKLIASHLGIGDEKIFENTIFVRTSELNPLAGESDAKRVKDRIEALLTGSRQVTATQALKSLDSAYRMVAGAAGRKGQGGEIDEFQTQIDELYRKMNAAKESEQQKLEIKKRLTEIDEEIIAKEANQQRLLVLAQAVKTNQQLAEVTERRRELSKKIEQIEEMRNEKERLSETAAARFDALPEDINRKMVLWNQKIKDEYSYTQSLASRQRFGLLISGSLLIILGLITAVLINLPAGIISSLIGSAAIVWSLHFGKSAKDIDEILGLEKQIKEVLDKTGSADVNEFCQKHEGWRDKKTKIGLLEDKITLLLSGDTLDNLKAARRELVDAEGKLTAGLDESIRRTLDSIPPEELIANQRLIQEQAVEIARLKEERSYLEGRLQGIGGSSLSEIEDDILFLQSRLDEATLKERALKMAKETLEKATGDLRQQLVPQINERADGLFKRFTKNNGRDLILDEQLKLTVGRSPKNTTDFLSSGTRDQAFFALRLAISGLICRDVKAPLILDDPFVFFDEERLESVGCVLQEIAADQQVILFSHDSFYHRWPGNVIELN